VVREWIERHLGPTGRIEDVAKDATTFLAGVPSLMTRGAVLVEHLDAITRDGLVLAPETVAAIGAEQNRRSRWKTAAIWVIAAALVCIALMLRFG
jgi:ubiquinone biosynthesis protein